MARFDKTKYELRRFSCERQKLELLELELLGLELRHLGSWGLGFHYEHLNHVLGNVMISLFQMRMAKSCDWRFSLPSHPVGVSPGSSNKNWVPREFKSG